MNMLIEVAWVYYLDLNGLHEYKSRRKFLSIYKQSRLSILSISICYSSYFFYLSIYVCINPGEENLDIQILQEEDLPDIDETDMIHGLDHTGNKFLKDILIDW